MIFPLEVTLRRRLPILTFNYAPILEIIKHDLENKNVDDIETIENGYAFRNKFFSFTRGKNNIMNGVSNGKFELENNSNGIILKYTYNIWIFVVIMLIPTLFVFLKNWSYEGPFFARYSIFSIIILSWLIILARHYFYLKDISKRIIKAQTNSI